MPDTLSTAPLIIQVHVVAAVLALCLAPVQFLRRPGGRRHKAIGYVWVCAMAGTALSSFAIHDIRLLGPFSPIHLLSAWVLYSLWDAIRAARRGDIARHRTTLRQNAFWGLGVAGAFTLLPGRLMSNTLFGEYAWPAFIGTLAVLVLARAGMWVRGRRAQQV